MEQSVKKVFRKNEIYRLEIIDTTAEGNGVGKIDDFAVFVPMTVAGDVIQTRLVKVLKHYAFGIVESFEVYAKERIPVDCDCYKQCGGCSLRHISYEAELQLKQKQVRDCFERIGHLNVPINPILGGNSIDGYRNKAQIPVAEKDGKMIAGFYAKRSHRVVECKNCLLQPKEFQSILTSILDFCNEFHITAYSEQTKKGLLRNIYLRRAEVTGEIMVCLVTTQSRVPHSDTLVERLKAVNSKISSILVNINTKDTNVILGKKCVTIYGKGSIFDVLCGIKVELSPLSFYQVNHAQAERLYRLAREYAGLTGKERVLDLYCGAGTIGLSMADQCEHLIGIEIVPEAIANARENAVQNGIANAEFYCADAGQAAKKLEERGNVLDVALLDPPRKGCSSEVLDSLSRMAPKRIVMISCNPSTAARDCRYLQEEHGYLVRKVTPVDLFPRTTHVECVVLMSKVKE